MKRNSAEESINAAYLHLHTNEAIALLVFSLKFLKERTWDLSNKLERLRLTVTTIYS